MTASTVCRERTTVSLVSAIGTVIFTVTPTCQRHTRTIQTSKVRCRTRCNQTSYTKTSQTYVYTHTLSHTQSIYIYSKHLIIQHYVQALVFNVVVKFMLLLYVTLSKNKYVCTK